MRSADRGWYIELQWLMPSRLYKLDRLSRHVALHSFDAYRNHNIFPAKMKVLHLNLLLLRFLSLYTDETCNRLLQTIRFVFFLLGIAFGGCVSSAIYVYYHFKDIETAANAFIVFTGGAVATCSLISFKIKFKGIQAIYRTLQSIVNTGKNWKVLKSWEEAGFWYHLIFLWWWQMKPMEPMRSNFMKMPSAKVNVISNI